MRKLKGHAADLVAGLEPKVAVAINVMVPLAIVARAASGFEAAFPTIALRLSIEALGAVVRPVIDGSDAFAIAGPLATEHAALASAPFPGVQMVGVVAPAHPAAAQAVTLRGMHVHCGIDRLFSTAVLCEDLARVEPGLRLFAPLARAA